MISLIYYSNSLGVSFGFLIPPFLGENPIEIVNLVMLVWNGLCCVMFIIFGLKEFPEKPPSKTAYELITKEKVNICSTICA